MWKKTYSTKVRGLAAEQLWKAWADVDSWHTWQDDIEFAKLEGSFVAGSEFTLKPKGGPKVRIRLTKVEANRYFSDLTRFPLARMVGEHEFVSQGDELEIKTTISVEGPLGFLWRKLVAEDVAKGLPAQTDSLVRRARSLS
jgi:hypothetical protein